MIVERRVVNHRTAGAAIEPRGVLADYRAGLADAHSSTQVPHFLRLFLALQLGISEERVRAIAPEVGGGFGSKLQIYGEEISLAWASRKLERPIKWIEGRSEGMQIDPPRARPDRVRADRRHPRRQDHRLPHEDPRRTSAPT